MHFVTNVSFNLRKMMAKFRRNLITQTLYFNGMYKIYFDVINGKFYVYRVLGKNHYTNICEISYFREIA
jgi:hypothetical protein